MSTAKTRRPGTAASSPRGTSAKTSNKASDAIPVLIRLPRVVLEPESDEEGAANEGEADLRATIPLIPAAADSQPPAGGSDDVPATSPGTVVGVQAGAASEMPLFGPRPSPWSQFRPPRWAIHGGIALGLIAVLVIAYAAIRGPAQNSNEFAEGGPALPAALPPPGIPAIGIPPPLAAAPAPVSDKPAADSSQAADEKKPAVEETPASPAVSGPDDAKDKSPATQPQPPVAAPKDAGAGQPGSASGAESAEKPPATELNAAAAGDATANTPLTSGPSAGDQQASAEIVAYPVTNPTTFQYPADYHQRLGSQGRPRAPELNGAGASGPSLNGPAASGAGPYGWQPNTARLQPRIEPPPVR